MVVTLPPLRERFGIHLGHRSNLGLVAVTVECHLIVDEGDREDVGLACVEGFRKAFNEDGG